VWLVSFLVVVRLLIVDLRFRVNDSRGALARGCFIFKPAMGESLWLFLFIRSLAKAHLPQSPQRPLRNSLFLWVLCGKGRNTYARDQL